MTEASRRYKECEKLIYKISWYWHFKTNVPFNDVHSEALELFMKAHNRFDKQRHTKFSTYLWRILHSRLDAYCRLEGRERHHLSHGSLLIGVETNPSLQTYCSVPPKFSGWDWSLRCEEISAEGIEVLQIVFHAPEEILGLDRPLRPKLVRGRIQRLLRKRGWQWETIWKVFRELRSIAQYG